MEPIICPPQPDRPASGADLSPPSASGQPVSGPDPLAALDRLLVILHDGGDPTAIRVCETAGIAADAARRATTSRGETARMARDLATVG